MSAAPALTAAILARLRADAALASRLADRIWDCAPRDPAFPHLVVDEVTSRDRSGFDAPLEELVVTLRVLSRAGGRAEVSAVADRVADLLVDADLPLVGTRLVLLRREATATRLLKDRLTTEATIRLAALAEPA